MKFTESVKKVTSCLAAVKWKKLLFPHTAVVILLPIISAVLLIAVFLHGYESHVLGICTYPLATYALTIVCAKIPGIVKASKNAVMSNQYSNRYVKDIPFRTMVNLIRSVGINFVFAIVKLVFAIYYSSFWFGALAVYYLVLCGIRLFLVRKVPGKLGERGYIQELKDFRTTGLLLFAVNVAVSGVAVQMIRDGQGYSYPELVIYAVAAYTFYSITMAIIGMVRYKKHNSPVISATKTINFTTSCVALFNLQTAMLAQFGQGQEQFIQIINTLTGTAVCVVILLTAIVVVRRADKALKEKGN